MAAAAPAAPGAAPAPPAPAPQQWHARAYPGGPWLPPLPPPAPLPAFASFTRAPAAHPALSDFVPLYAGLGGGSGAAGAAGWGASAARPPYMAPAAPPPPLPPLSRNATRLGAVLGSLRASGLLGVGGFLTTTRRHTGQQWDGVNAWSPLQDLMVEGLRGAGGAPAAALAREAARRWLNNSLTAYDATGSMHEKLRGDALGLPGGGGEYTAVRGPFGWSNAVALKFALDYDFADLSSSGGGGAWA